MAFPRRGPGIFLSILLYRGTMSFLYRIAHPHRSRTIAIIGARKSNFHSSVSKLSPSSSVTAVYSDIDEAIRGVEPSTPSYLDMKPTEQEIETLYTFLKHKRNVLVITGAGISTSSGVPDYRGPLGSYKLGDSFACKLFRLPNMSHMSTNYPEICSKDAYVKKIIQKGLFSICPYHILWLTSILLP